MKLAKATLDYQHDGQIATVRLAAPKANILDQEMMANLCEIFQLIPES
jgi:enoyl-CoA hydratase/carnithine racemase